YCEMSSLLALAGSFGLLARRRWGPPLAALAGLSWAVTSIGFFIYDAAVFPRVTAFAPRTQVQRDVLAYAGGAVVAMILGILLMTPLYRPAIRSECGDTTPSSGSFTRIAVVFWGLCALSVTSAWIRWYLKLWGL